MIASNNELNNHSFYDWTK